MFNVENNLANYVVSMRNQFKSSCKLSARSHPELVTGVSGIERLAYGKLKDRMGA